MMNKIKNKIKDFLVNTFSVNLVLIIALILIPKAYSKPLVCWIHYFLIQLLN